MKKAGARVLTLDQIEGLKVLLATLLFACCSLLEWYPRWKLEFCVFQDPNVECWANEEEDSGDPPRLWAPNAMLPGTAFTRSIGDGCAFPPPALNSKQGHAADNHCRCHKPCVVLSNLWFHGGKCGVKPLLRPCLGCT